MKKINVAIIGVGSFTKALVEGVSYYTKNPDEKIGLMNPIIAGYKVKDINFVAAFDVDERKVGKKLHEAIGQGANITRKITEPIAYSAMVYRGPTLDGVIKEMQGAFVKESNKPAVDITKILKECGADIVVNLIPSGSDEATYIYAEAALKANCSFINCTPTPLATIPKWRKLFADKGLVLLGDDTKSQVGATMLNRFLLELLQMRGIKVTKSEQENRGGNADHFNLLYRTESKERSKREALAEFLEGNEVKPKVSFHYTGQPSGHKKVILKIEGEMFGKIPILITSEIEDEISINGAATAVDAIRIAKALAEKGKQQLADEVCAFLMKSPYKTMTDKTSYEAFRRVMSACG